MGIFRFFYIESDDEYDGASSLSSKTASVSSK